MMTYSKYSMRVAQAIVTFVTKISDKCHNLAFLVQEIRVLVLPNKTSRDNNYRLWYDAKVSIFTISNMLISEAKF